MTIQKSLATAEKLSDQMVKNLKDMDFSSTNIFGKSIENLALVTVTT